MKVIFGNYGNDTIALIQWAYEHSLDDLVVIDIDTGWSAPEWHERVQACQAWVESLGFRTLTLKPKVNFAELMHVKGEFPTRKFQWCANFLKGLPLLEWLDQSANDPNTEACILLALRRASSRRLFNLEEWIEESEEFGGREVWHPLYLHSHVERDALVEQTPISLIHHRSLECDPCVNSDAADVLRMELSVIERCSELEKTLGMHLLDPAIYQGSESLVEAVKTINATPQSNTNELFDMGCGSTFACGL